MVYDTDYNITWLRDANYAYTRGYSPATGAMSWDDAMAWAGQLTYGGYSDWRLPTALNRNGSGPCEGTNCSGSELGHLFYSEIRATSATNSAIFNGDPTELAKFTNIQNAVYWTSTTKADYPGGAWDFYTESGIQGNAFKSLTMHAWAVRDGDVAASVPEPATAWLIAAGVLGLARGKRPRVGRKMFV